MSTESTMVCRCCERDCPKTWMQKHHLKTKKVDKKLIEWLCKDCHRAVHALFSIKELRKQEDLTTLEGLRTKPEFVKAVEYIKTQTPGKRIRMRTSKRTRKRKR